MAIADHLVELRGDIPRDYMEVIDAVVQATPGANRMTVVRDVLAEWTDRKIHESTLIQRCTVGQRKRTGSRTEA